MDGLAVEVDSGGLRRVAQGRREGLLRAVCDMCPAAYDIGEAERDLLELIDDEPGSDGVDGVPVGVTATLRETTAG